MRTLFFDAERRLRNGWWMLAFVGCIAATRFVYGPLTRGLREAGAPEAWIEPVPFLLTLAATWACTLLRREPLSSVGFRLDAAWARQLAVGVGLGGGSMLAAAGLIWAIGGVTFELDPSRSVGALAMGLYLFFFAALLEENLFRGFLFQRLVAGTGAWFAQLVLALLFAFGHWDNPGMDGVTRVVASVELALAAILLGLAYLRTRSLALPVGLHLGWNWAQGHVLGFGVSGLEHTGWLRPVFHGGPEWLTGGPFGPEASVFAVLVDLVLLGALWRWGRSPSAPEASAGYRRLADQSGRHYLASTGSPS